MCNSTRDQNHRTSAQVGGHGGGHGDKLGCADFTRNLADPPVGLRPATGHSADLSPITCVLGAQSRATATPSEPGVLGASVVSPSTLP